MICKQQSRIHNGKSKRTLAKLHPRMEMATACGETIHGCPYLMGLVTLVTLVVGRIYDF